MKYKGSKGGIFRRFRVLAGGKVNACLIQSRFRSRETEITHLWIDKKKCLQSSIDCGGCNNGMIIHHVEMSRLQLIGALFRNLTEFPVQDELFIRIIQSECEVIEWHDPE